MTMAAETERRSTRVARNVYRYKEAEVAIVPLPLLLLD
jgi:hypothetical protein